MTAHDTHGYAITTDVFDRDEMTAATRNGYLGFVVFHAALAMVVSSLFVADRRARLLVFARDADG